MKIQRSDPLELQQKILAISTAESSSIMTSIAYFHKTRQVRLPLQHTSMDERYCYRLAKRSNAAKGSKVALAF
jgi:hypothetical protein